MASTAGACTTVRHDAPTRAEWIRQELLARNRDSLVHDKNAVAEKFSRMSRSIFAFFRGSSDLLPPQPTGFASPAASRVAIIGDPHPENIGTFRTAAGVRVVDFNDFDVAGYGSYVEDLRRLAVGLWLTAGMAELREKQRVRVVEDLCAGYAGEIQALAKGAPPFALHADQAFGGDIEQILVDGEDEASTLARGVEVSPDERALVATFLAAYPASLLDPARFPAAMFAIKRVVRVNAGVSSFAVSRFRVLVEGPGPAPDDDWVLEVKETRGRPAALLVTIQRQFQETPDDDVLLGWARAGGREFRVRRVSPDQRRLSVDRIAKQVKSPRWGKKDLREVATDAGRLLARGHARTRGADGLPGIGALAPVVGDGAGLTRETVDYTLRAAAVVESDFATFRTLIAQQGSLLGWQNPNR